MSTQNNNLEKKNINRKYILAAAVAVIAIGTLACGTTKDNTGTNKGTQQGQEVLSGQEYQPATEFDVDVNEELTNLMTTYFQAYVNADFATLEKVASPLSEMEKSYITEMSKYYEQYQNIKIYSKQGLSKNSYIVSTVLDIKFYEKEQTAPSMLLFYVQTREDGSLYINNLYSEFNLVYSEVGGGEPDVYNALRKYTSQQDYSILYDEVDQKLTAVINENDELRKLLTREIPLVRQKWEDSVYYPSKKTTESTEEVPSTEQAPSTEQTPSTEQVPSAEQTPSTEQTPNTQETTPPVEQQPQAPTKVKVHADTLNIRESASADSRLLLQLDKSDVCMKLGVEGEWTKVEHNGVVGFVKSEFLTDVTE